MRNKRALSLRIVGVLPTRDAVRGQATPLLVALAAPKTDSKLQSSEPNFETPRNFAWETLEILR
jgi:hypothetical protein